MDDLKRKYLKNILPKANIQFMTFEEACQGSNSPSRTRS